MPDASNVTLWKRKLMAFLQDPPCVCFGIAEHERVAELLRREAGIDEEEFKGLAHEHVQAASAADCLPFPDHRCTSPLTAGEEFAFVHPLCESRLVFRVPEQPEHLAEASFRNAVGGTLLDLDWNDRFFLCWRYWRDVAGETDGRLAWLPADTRMPDHSVWTHMSVASALRPCVHKGSLEAAFLLFHLSGVQDFIAQAQSTRDLRAGSYMFSFLIASALKAVADILGPDAIIFPNLRGQPVFDLLYKTHLYDRIKFDDGTGGTHTLWQRMYELKANQHDPVRGINEALHKLLTPTIPNRFLALVPRARGCEIAKAADIALRQALQLMADRCWEAVKEGKTELDRRRWEQQVRLFPQVAWQVVPWERDVTAALKLLERVTFDSDDSCARNLQALMHLATERVPEAGRGPRHYTDRAANNALGNRGLAWAANYAVTDFALAARRNTRDFAAFDTDAHQTGSRKDFLSGREEVIGGEDRGALNLIKKHFFEHFLGPLTGYTERQIQYNGRFLSTVDIAKRNTDRANPYFAVLALDGDHMGEWASGRRMPLLSGKLSSESRDFLARPRPERSYG